MCGKYIALNNKASWKTGIDTDNITVTRYNYYVIDAIRC